jgi:hypothetical protein
MKWPWIAVWIFAAVMFSGLMIVPLVHGGMALIQPILGRLNWRPLSLQHLQNRFVF